MKWLALAGAVAAVTVPVAFVTYDVIGETAANAAIMASVLGLPAAPASRSCATASTTSTS